MASLFRDVVPEALQIDFTNRINILLQQTESKTLPFTTIRPLNAESGTITRLSPINAEKKQSRHEEPNREEAQYETRHVKADTYTAEYIVDQQITAQMVADPTSGLAESLVASIMREKDRIILDAALGDVLTDQTGTTTLTFANDDTNTIDATGGLTYAKVLEIQQKFESQVGDQITGFALFITEQEKTDLMQEIDYLLSLSLCKT